MSTEPIDGVVFEEDDDGYVVRFDSDDGSEAEPEPEPTPEPEPEPEPEPTLEPEAGLEGQGDEPFEFDEELDEMVEIDPNADNLDEVFARLSAGEPVARIFSNATATFSGHTGTFCHDLPCSALPVLSLPGPPLSLASSSILADLATWRPDEEGKSELLVG